LLLVSDVEDAAEAKEREKREKQTATKHVSRKLAERMVHAQAVTSLAPSPRV